jgi:putative Ca2+/H+ antiporter (TMEM165/GDT1 family)
MRSLVSVFATSYGAVFIAEIVGDKLLYTSGVLAVRYRWTAILLGMSVAFMAKMSVAVALGEAIGTLLPHWLVALMAAVSFAGVAVTMWRKPDIRKPKEKDSRMLQGMLAAFVTIFFSEWGDKGMMTAATMAAWASTQAKGHSQLQVALLVWVAAVGAMVTKGGLAVTLGASVRQWIADHIQPRYVRYLAVTAIVVLGVLCALEAYGIVD